MCQLDVPTQRGHSNPIDRPWSTDRSEDPQKASDSPGSVSSTAPLKIAIAAK